MNKYELALVVSAKVEDEVRDAVVEKAKGYITRYNGTITEVEEWGKKKLAYEIQKTYAYHGQCIKILSCQKRRISFWQLIRKHH